MPPPLALIQLVSEQTMPNLLPVLRLRPARLIHLVTPRTAVRSDWIIEAARQAGQQPETEAIPLSAMPTMAETFNAVREAIGQTRDAGHTPVVNFTGGTKLMSIGAYAAALRAEHSAASLYVDTEDQEFVDGHTADGIAGLLENDYSFTPLHRRLTVNTIAVANGRERVTEGRDWRPYLALARHLLGEPADEEATQDAFFGRSGLCPAGRTPRSPEEWLDLLDTSFRLPSSVARLAGDAGLLRAGNDGTCRLPDTARRELDLLSAARARGEFVANFDERRIAATDQAQWPVTYLTGAWWEVVVAEAAASSALFRDLRWSASVGDRSGASLEEDLLAVQAVQLVCLSCKRGGRKARLLPHLEELHARARAIGGHFTRRFLAVRYPPRGRAWDSIHRRANELSIRLLTPGDLRHPEAFHPGAVH